ncbi:MAG: hypothetical protein ACXWFB_10765, partial [Nitrososphaeraceae archaeon]
MAEFFFTEYSKLNAQADTEAYGPVKNFEDNKYRVTSKITSTTAANAYAVTDGKILVQSQSNANFVNLLLFPTTSSKTGFTPVLFYVYRGLKKENFIDSNGKIVALSTPKSSDLTNKVWDSFTEQKTRNPAITTTEPNIKSIGWNYNTSLDTVLILEIFKHPDPDFELIDVAAGDFIGVFDGSIAHPIGFEICLKEKFYDYSLKDLRADELVIEPMYQIQGSDSPGRLTVQQMRERENILNFVDPAAYFNIHYNLIVKGKIGTAETPFTKLEIAQNLANNFFTARTVYIDIRNENGYSLNYYKDFEGSSSNPDYGMHIQIGTQPNAVSPTNYYYHYWPIYTCGLTSSANFENIYLSISNEFDKNIYVYYDCAFYYKNNILSEISSVKFNSLVQPSGTWSSIFHVSIPINVTDCVSWINKLYIGRRSYTNLPATVPIKQHYLDYLFGPLTSVSSTPPSIGTSWQTVLGKKLVYSRPLGFVGAVEIIVLETSNLICFRLNIFDVRAINTSLINFDSKVNSLISFDAPSGFGLSGDDKIIIENDKTKVDIRTKSIASLGTSIITYLYDDDAYGKRPLCELLITRAEYTTDILPAINTVDQSIHDATLSIIGVSSAGPSTQSL